MGSGFALGAGSGFGAGPGLGLGSGQGLGTGAYRRSGLGLGSRGYLQQRAGRGGRGRCRHINDAVPHTTLQVEAGVGQQDLGTICQRELAVAEVL